MIVVDTSVLIDVLRGSAPAVDWLRRVEELPACSEVTRVEILRGMRSSERGATQRLLDALQWVDVDAAVSQRAGELGRTHRASHQGLALADLVIAATAQLHRAQLATRSVRHFPMFPGLAPPYES